MNKEGYDMQNQHYHDFYSTAFVPARPFEGRFLPNSIAQRPTSSHWLIALEGSPLPEGSHYTWKVSVYAANRDGSFNANDAKFSSGSYRSLHEAFESARQLKNEMNIQEKETTPANLEKIG
jgi:hypothetical protein